MHSCEVGWNRGLCHSNTFTGVFYFLEELMLDVKRIRNDFDALAEKLATRGVAAETLNELKELDVKRRELLINLKNSRLNVTLLQMVSLKLSVTKKMLPNKSQQCKSLCRN